MHDEGDLKVAVTGTGWRTWEARTATVLALAVVSMRVLLTRPLTFCGTPDACYYLGMAQTLAAGKGFHARFLYDFQQAHLALPNTGIEYWRPGVSLLLLILRPLGGVTLHSSIVITALAGVVYAAAAWHIAMRAYGDRRIALGGFSLCLLSSAAWIGSLSPDSSLFYGAAVGWFLALFTVQRQGLLADLLALSCVSLAYLIRNDAALLLMPLVAVLWHRHRGDATAENTGAAPVSVRNSPAYSFAMLAGFFLALLPMHLLYLAVLGTAFPSGTAQVLFLHDLSDFSRYGASVNRHTLLAYGWKHLLVFRMATLGTLLYRIAVLLVGYAALVFLPGLFLNTSQNSENSSPQSQDRRRVLWQGLPELTGSLAFFVTILFVYTLVLPAIGGFSALRSVTAILPLLAVLTMVAISRVARTPQVAGVLAIAVVSANTLSGLLDDSRAVSAANRIGDADRAEAQQMLAWGANPQSNVVLTGDPVQFSVTTGFAAVALPRNGLGAIAQAAHDLQATHVLLDTEDLPAAPETVTQRLGAIRSITLPAEHALILVLPIGTEDRLGHR